MAHLKQKQISDTSCKAIIIDTLLDTVRPLTQSELSDEITSLFHILISTERLNQLIDALVDEEVIFFDAEDHLGIVATKKAEFIIARLQEESLRKEATLLWIKHIRSTREISSELETLLSQALPIFLRSLFVKHGVSSFELLTSSSDWSSFDLKQIASNVAQQFDEAYWDELNDLLPTVFQVPNEAKVISYLKLVIEKAVGYISEVISDENFEQITGALKDLKIYLDTNTIYRLLNLQGNSRYESIQETLNFCRANGVKLMISAITKTELSARLNFDAKILLKFPTKTNLAKAGYKYRTSENYVSTYWLQTQKTQISVEDFVAHYRNFDILLRAEQIEIEETEVDEEALIARTKNFFEKLSLRDPYHEKSTSSLWHDAYNFAYVQKMQKAGAANAIDARCLFLTADQALTSFQREDYELKECSPIAIAPSQLLQMFAFSQAASGYEETFIKFFASSSLGTSFRYSNDDIQEILSRIGHYQGVSTDIAERILARELLSSRYFDVATDEEKEEIIYNSISEELQFELDFAKEQVASLKNKNSRLDEDYQEALNLLLENEEQFAIEKMKLQAEASVWRNAEAVARERAEEASRNAREYSAAQEDLYVSEKLAKWKKRHSSLFWCGIVLSLSTVILAIFLSVYLEDSGWLGVLGGLTLTAIPLTYGTKGFSAKSRLEACNEIRDDYRKKLKTTKLFEQVR